MLSLASGYLGRSVNHAARQQDSRARRKHRPAVEWLEDYVLLAGVTINEFPIPSANERHRTITAGPDGNVWFTEDERQPDRADQPDDGRHHRFPVPTADGGPDGITAGPDGNLWFTETGGDKIGEINPTTHVITEFPIPTAGSGPDGITAGPDGNLWFTESTVQPDRHDQPDDARHHRVPHPHGQQLARRDHGRPRRQPLVHRGMATRSG